MPLDATDVAWLLTPEGVRATEAAEAALRDGTPALTLLDRLRRDHTPDQARSAVALAEGRRSATTKFKDAASLYFDRESAEQATSDIVALHTARRFQGAHRIADLGCGAGGDALALALHAPVLAVDRAPGRLALTRANAAVRGLGDRVEAIEADVLEPLAGDIDAAWLDPARRDSSGRVMDPERWSPSLTDALRIASGLARAGIKVAPGIDLALIPPDAEVEFISLEGRLVEAVVWLGTAVTAFRRATALPSGASIDGTPDAGGTPLSPPGHYLYDLDPAVGRASLVDRLAHELGAWLLDDGLAYLSGNMPIDSPFARRFRVESVVPFAERRLLDALRGADAGRVEVMRRGSPVDTNALELRLNRALPGDGRVLTVALTRSRGEHIAIVCERER